MEPAHYTDPLEESLSHASQRVAQVAALTAAMTQVVMQRRALADARRSLDGDATATRALDGQERILRQQARLTWAPAHDRQWLTQAGLADVARAWAAAAGCADGDPPAAAALRKCEDRLRQLHPHAMARYDRLRSDGVDPLTAMHQAAPLFALVPNARPGDPAPERHSLAAGTGQETWSRAGQGAEGPAEPGLAEEAPGAAERRGRQIAGRLQARARATGRPVLGPDEMATVLETVTNLPDNVIRKLTRQDAGATGVSRQPTRSAAQLAAENFPHTAAAAVRAAAGRRNNATAAQAPSPSQTPRRAKRPGRSL